MGAHMHTFLPIFEKLKKELPVIFAGTELDRLTGRGYRWRTLQNEISRGEAPADICLMQGRRKKLVDRDRFLDYWQSKIIVSETPA